MVVDVKNRRLFELVEGRTVGETEAALGYIPGYENVRHVVIDMCDPYRSFANRFFPNARLVAESPTVRHLGTVREAAVAMAVAGDEVGGGARRHHRQKPQNRDESPRDPHTAMVRA